MKKLINKIHNINEKTLWSILKVCIALIYVLVGFLVFYRIALYANWYYLNHQSAIKHVVFWFLMIVEILPILLLKKGVDYLHKKIHKALGLIDDYDD